MYPVPVLFYPDPLFYIRILDFFQNLDIFVKLNLLSYPVFGLFITNNYDDINILFNNVLYNVYCILYTSISYRGYGMGHHTERHIETVHCKIKQKCKLCGVRYSSFYNFFLLTVILFL